MKKFAFLMLSMWFLMLSAQPQRYPIVPEPKNLQPKEGYFLLNNNTILTSPQMEEMVTFNTKLEKSLGINIAATSRNLTPTFIRVNAEDFTISEEGYVLDISANEIQINASTPKGVFYALQTLYQLMPPEVNAGIRIDSAKVLIPQCRIEDEPRFPYRGSHLDVCRYFRTVEEVKEHIEHIAMYKLNYFHWHLTDDQGWRIEIKKYPKLQTIASQRSETWIGHFSSGLGYDGIPHGGYYTQSEVREIVEFAKKHHVTIIPEIEMPGHSSAAIAAYPELSCTGVNGPHKVEGTWGVFDDVFCTSEETFEFLQNVIDEVLDLFPDAPYIHIGGDECPKTRWKACPKCQERIRKEGLKDEFELQSYFLNRMSRYIISKGRKVIAWDEALEGGVPDDLIIMSWQGEQGGIAAAQQKHQAIMTPCAYLYLNYYQGEPESEPLAIGGYVPLQKVYNYDPITRALSAEEQKYIIGAQANLWTEYIKDWELAEYMLFPRLLALSEVVWSPKSLRNYGKFIEKLNHHFTIFFFVCMNYSKSHFNVTAATDWNTEEMCPQVSLQTACPDCDIRYTLNGKIPTIENAQIYVEPITIRKNSTLCAMAFRNGKPYSSTFKETYKISPSTGKSYSMKNINPQYSGGHELALTDGVLGTSSSWNKWVGTLANDLEVVLDLGEKTAFSSVTVQLMHAPGSWIFAPLSVSVWISDDGENWQSETKISLAQYQTSEGDNVINAKVPMPAAKARYVKVFAPSIKHCPEGHPGAGYDAHLFAGEIIVE